MTVLSAASSVPSGLLAELSPACRAAYAELCAGVSHLRPQTARSYSAGILPGMQPLDRHACREALLEGVLGLSRFNWALTQPFLEALPALPSEDAFIRQWSGLGLELARQDIDVGVAFLKLTPLAMEKLGHAEVLGWGRRGSEALSGDRRMWKAVAAYLRESADPQCGFTPTQWAFFLGQARRIAEASPAAAEAFVQLGRRACLLLTEEETVRWVAAGIETSATEQDLINFFGATSLKALETRDGLTSGVALKDRSHTLGLICEALMGRPVKIRSCTGLYGVKGFGGGAATDGRSIFLPEIVPRFSLMKLMALHQAMLLDRHQYLEAAGRIFFDPVHLHLYADKRLAQRMPGLAAEMRREAGDDLPASYPHRTGKGMGVPLPWWGDILPQLVSETSSTLNQLQERAAEQYDDLPPGVVEMLLASLMSEGQRDPDALWQMFAEIADQMEFISPDAEELPDSVKTFNYKEWDANLSDYKLDWCLVRQRPAKDDPNPFVEEVRTRLHGLITLIRRQFMRLKPELFRKFRAQPIGDALDIDALVEALVDMRSGAFLSENVYIRRDKRVRDVAVLFLVDLSASTEEKVGERRIVDVQKEAMVLMAEALDSLEDPYAIFGFSTDGRFRIDLFQVKEFDEPYNERARHRLGNLQPAGQTRMGAVLRHAIYKLDSVSAAIKLLVILTDGRPYDVEYGNLDYAVADTKKAIQEARRKKIHPFIITSDQKSGDYLRRIAPQTQSIIVPNVEILPRLLPAIYKRLTV
jgi:hypothetical protein